MYLGSGDTDTQACIKCCFRRDEVKSIEEKRQLQCKKVGPERTHRVLQNSHQTGLHSWVGRHLDCHPRCLPFFLVFYASDEAGRHRRARSVPVLLERRRLTQSVSFQDLPLTFRKPSGWEPWKMGGTESGSQRKLWMQDQIKLRRIVQLSAGLSSFKLKHRLPHWPSSKSENFHFAEIWWEMWLGLQDELIMFRSQLLSWIRLFRIV